MSSGRRNNEPRIRTERTRIIEQQKYVNKKIQYSIILEKIKRTILPGFENIQCLEA
jgi:hypothetical protein